MRGNTNGSSTIGGYLQRMGHELHQNPVPTGYDEVGASWLGTNNTLERTAFGEHVARSTGSNFGGDVIGLLTDNGIPTAPGNAAAIVDFFAGILFGGAMSPAERQAAIDFLLTDDSGNPDPGYNNARIRGTVGFMLGYAGFQEQ